jgi:drug/metabolite transporter (DMT)-like permease
MPDKLKSRKFWLAVVAQIVGIVVLVWGTQAGDMVSTITGSVITVLSALGYLKAEGDIDKASASK